MTENLRNLFEAISQNKLPYCRICFRTDAQRKLIVSEAYKKWVQSLNNVLSDCATEEGKLLLCTICQRKVCTSLRLIAMTKFGARSHKLYNLFRTASELKDMFTLNYCHGQMKLNSVLFSKVRGATELKVTETLVVTGNSKETALMLPAKPASVASGQIVGTFNTVVSAPLVPRTVTVTPGAPGPSLKTPNPTTKLRELLMKEINNTIEKKNKPNNDEIVISDEESEISTLQNAVIEAIRHPTHNTGENRPKVQRNKAQKSKAPLILRHASEKTIVTPSIGSLTTHPAQRMMGVRDTNGETSYYHVEGIADDVLYVPALKARILDCRHPAGHYLADTGLKHAQSPAETCGASERTTRVRERRPTRGGGSVTSRPTTGGATVRPDKSTGHVDWEARIPMDVISYADKKPKRSSSECPLGVIASVYSERAASPQLGTSVSNN